jgi:hypothetical protein
MYAGEPVMVTILTRSALSQVRHLLHLTFNIVHALQGNEKCS